jgi:membrane-bound lytic murein transglycosylase B
MIVLQNSPNTKKHCIGLSNFYAVMRYNNSVHYAMAVHDLGERLKHAYYGRKSE